MDIVRIYTPGKAVTGRTHAATETPEAEFSSAADWRLGGEQFYALKCRLIVSHSAFSFYLLTSAL